MKVEGFYSTFFFQDYRAYPRSTFRFIPKRRLSESETLAGLFVQGPCGESALFFHTRDALFTLN